MTPPPERERAEIPASLPLLPLRDAVVFPYSVMPLMASGESQVRLVEDAMRGSRMLGLFLQSGEAEKPNPSDLRTTGTAAVVHRMTRRPDGALQMVVQGVARIRLSRITQTEPYLSGLVEAAPEQAGEGIEFDALANTARDLFQRLVAASPQLPKALGEALSSISSPLQLAYLIAAAMPMPTEERQAILELDSVAEKLRWLVSAIQRQLAVAELEHRIAAETEQHLGKQQRDILLRERLRTIQRELGEDDDPDRAAVEDLRKKIETLPLPEEARREAERELSRLARMPAMSVEHGMIRAWLDWLTALPWGKSTAVPIDLNKARQILDEDHHDLEKIKQRIVESLAVKKLRDERQQGPPPPGPSPDPGQAGPLPQAREDDFAREPILCLVGPPGVGKTSLGQSVARATGRQFVRISLGGVHDEAEIRGHRRTYIGAMPGRIVQALRRAGSMDPVFMLDEIDKLAASFHGDPAAALLEVLDPAQNRTFTDTYLGVPFDLSRVLFLCTANTIDTIAPALLDRMEMVSLSGYTEEEKLRIARSHLVPKQQRAHGLREGEVQIPDELLRRVIREYTREAGVRGLERGIAALMRKAALRIGEGAPAPVTLSDADVKEALGRPRFHAELAERVDRPGVATGLAWTPAGGDVLFVEAALTPASGSGGGSLQLTGMLGEVMRESAQAALTYLRSNAGRLGLGDTALDGKSVHVHVPAGATPKDGPSAGVTMLTALASAAQQRPVRSDLAMTGEITLRGKVLPVGGIKEKVLAAYRAGVKDVVLPRLNEPDLDDVPAEVRRTMRFTPVDSADEVLREAFPVQAPSLPPEACATDEERPSLQ
ncbi:MAG TPA: endopeptidase La [Myxococcales bacterium]|nr:endopeptidase La [Myxococcales bacterium]